MNNTIYDVDYTRSLPPSLKVDECMMAIAKSLADQMTDIVAKIKKVNIYSRFDELPEELIDLLAVDFHVDWYDSRLPVQIKREIVKNSIKVHKYLGTRYSVESVLKEIYRDVKITEWFEKSPKGSPFTFSLDLDVSSDDVPKELQQEMLKKIYFYKNLRSHLEGINISIESEGFLYFGGYGNMPISLDVSADETADNLAKTGTAYFGGHSTTSQDLNVIGYE